MVRSIRRILIVAGPRAIVPDSLAAGRRSDQIRLLQLL